MTMIRGYMQDGYRWYRFHGDKEWQIVKVSTNKVGFERRRDVWFYGNEQEVSLDKAQEAGEFGPRISQRRA